jgi:hypothetical protein
MMAARPQSSSAEPQADLAAPNKMSEWVGREGRAAQAERTLSLDEPALARVASKVEIAPKSAPMSARALGANVEFRSGVPAVREFSSSNAHPTHFTARGKRLPGSFPPWRYAVNLPAFCELRHARVTVPHER